METIFFHNVLDLLDSYYEHQKEGFECRLRVVGENEGFELVEVTKGQLTLDALMGRLPFYSRKYSDISKCSYKNNVLFKTIEESLKNELPLLTEYRPLLTRVKNALERLEACGIDEERRIPSMIELVKRVITVLKLKSSPQSVSSIDIREELVVTRPALERFLSKEEKFHSVYRGEFLGRDDDFFEEDLFPTGGDVG